MICIDSYVAAKLFFEEHSAGARALLHDTLAAAEPIIAPHMLPSEVANIVRQNTRQGKLDHDGAHAILAQFLAIPIEFMALTTLYHRALAIANAHNVPAVYDAHYIAVAELPGAALWTADHRLLHALGDAFHFVQSIADYAISE